ncbi:MAG: hypothetical protein IJ944_03150 [Clostridia bacterium]|nr:hypothetical protein [Clostridia bacterium]
MEQQKTKQEQEYAPNGKPIVYEISGKDAEYHFLYKIGIWAIVIIFIFSLLMWLGTGDWEALIFNVFGLIIGIPGIITGKKKCNVVYRLTEEKKKKRKFAIIFCIILFTISFIIYLISGGSSDSEWSRLSDKEKDDVRSAVSFYEAVKDAADDYR